MKKIGIKGVIVPNDDAEIYDWFGMENTTPKKVAKFITDANGDELEVEINSSGGSVFAGSEIYTALKSYTGNVTVKIVGLAASAASVVAMAGKKILMSPTAQIMIHNVASIQCGDYRDMEHMSTVLKNANDTIANAYRIKSGMEQKDLLKLMEAETWFTAKQALEFKLIDEVLFESNQFESVQLVASYNSNMLPRSVIDKIRNTIKDPLKNDADIFMQKAQAKLKLLNLKKEV